jgi:hypothetical protein
VTGLDKTVRVLFRTGLGFGISLLCFILLRRLTPLTFMAAVIVAFVCGVYSSFDISIPWSRRLAVSYLVFVSVIYFWAGVAGLKEYGELFADLFWYFLTVSPFPLFHIMEKCVQSFPCRIFEVAYDPLPTSTDESRIISIIVIYLALAAIVAAFAMLKEERLGYLVWFPLVNLSIVTALCNVLADLNSVFAWLPVSGATRFPLYSLFWSASYGLAYWAIRRRGDPTLPQARMRS